MWVSRPTVSGKHPRLGACGLAHHDGSLGVVLLHGRVGAVEESPARKVWRQSMAQRAIHLEVGVYTPCGSACLRGLAEGEAKLLQALGENVLARHDVF
jgi:hypothetical protein